MAHRKQINASMDSVLTEEVNASIESELIEEYKKLNEKCDTVITKIKNRKAQTKKQK